MNLLSSLLKYTADQIAALRAKNTSQDTTVSGIDTRLGTAETKVTNMEAQLATAISAVTVDSEVQNIRVGDDNVTYTSAGEAVRTQFSNVKSDINEIITNDILWGRYGLLPADGTTDINTPSNNKYRLCTMEMVELNDVSVTGAGVFNVFMFDDSFTFLGSLGAWVSSKTKSQLLSAQPTAKYMRVLFKRNDGTETALTDPTTYGIKITGTKLSQSLKDVGDVHDYWGCEQGSVTPTGIIAKDTTRLRILSFIKVESGKEYTVKATPSDSSKNLNVGVSVYANSDFSEQRITGTAWSASNEMTISIPDVANYIIVIIRFSNNATIVPSDLKSFSITTNTDDSVVGFLDSVGMEESYLESGTFTEAGLNYADPRRLRSVSYIPVSGGQQYEITAFASNPSTPLKVSASFYNANDYTTARIGYTQFVVSPAIITVPSGATFMRLLVSFIGDTTITADDVTACIVKKEYAVSNYAIESNLLKQEVRLEHLGMLTYVQAFCKYNSKYYSIDGNNIGVQSSDFTAESTASLNTGHGNSLQLGSNGIAYASGWNDQNVYAIDLANLTITDTIALPTTGYTTCAIDDINKVAYIFQRTSYPDTEANYNFIVYDYDNDQIISTKKLTNKFGAMQACDFYNGKIAVIYGLGTSAVPNGLCIYNTNGDVLAEYNLEAFASIEPEGVFFDRDSHELLISLVNKNTYRISL